MIHADSTPNHEICPDCGGDASDKQRPESGWFVCECGYEFEKQLQETWLQLDQDEQAITDFCEDKL